MHAKSTANRVGAAFIPAISPGFNDRAVRGGHGGRGRSFIDVPNSKKGDVFRSMIKDVALPLLDQSADRIMMVTSFNEWYEDTQIEATTGTMRATTRDDSPRANTIRKVSSILIMGHSIWISSKTAPS